MTASERNFSRIEIDERARVARHAWERLKRPSAIEFITRREFPAGNVRDMLHRLTVALNGSALRRTR
jgi:hypothetical protein